MCSAPRKLPFRLFRLLWRLQFFSGACERQIDQSTAIGVPSRVTVPRGRLRVPRPTGPQREIKASGRHKKKSRNHLAPKGCNPKKKRGLLGEAKHIQKKMFGPGVRAGHVAWGTKKASRGFILLYAPALGRHPALCRRNGIFLPGDRSRKRKWCGSLARRFLNARDAAFIRSSFGYP
jgi:hypothetical protein